MLPLVRTIRLKFRLFRFIQRVKTSPSDRLTNLISLGKLLTDPSLSVVFRGVPVEKYQPSARNLETLVSGIQLTVGTIIKERDIYLQEATKKAVTSVMYLSPEQTGMTVTSSLYALGEVLIELDCKTLKGMTQSDMDYYNRKLSFFDVDISIITKALATSYNLTGT